MLIVHVGSMLLILHSLGVHSYYAQTLLDTSEGRNPIANASGLALVTTRMSLSIVMFPRTWSWSVIVTGQAPSSGSGEEDSS